MCDPINKADYLMRVLRSEIISKRYLEIGGRIELVLKYLRKAEISLRGDINALESEERRGIISKFKRSAIEEFLIGEDIDYNKKIVERINELEGNHIIEGRMLRFLIQICVVEIAIECRINPEHLAGNGFEVLRRKILEVCMKKYMEMAERTEEEVSARIFIYHCEKDFKVSVKDEHEKRRFHMENELRDHIIDRITEFYMAGMAGRF